ncbi:hypothetical protein MNBD_NITROSPINAE02-817 [hydrothermal vent metagenome]|uniref:FlgO domain-containing protein n=1 Tax=hydrothermal vent metagenome TaxID=652676 RepID=A0A3B1CCY6_9ZZZZ
MLRLIVFSLAGFLFFAGCSQHSREPEFQRELNSKPIFAPSSNAWPSSSTYTQRFVWKMRHVTDQLIKKIGVKNISKVSVLMTTIVPVDNILKPTSFGRMCAEQLMTEMSMGGFNVIESRMTEGYFIRNNVGEFMLSRDVKLVGKQHNARLALVGTYSESGGQVLINVRLVDTENAGVVATANTMMNLSGDKYLLSILKKDKKTAQSLEGMSSISVTTKIDPEEDPYSDVLNAMTRVMAHDLSDPVPAVNGKKLAVAVTTFVDVDHMYRSATFGRYMTERMMAELSSMGFDVVEFRMAEDVFIDMRIGELALSREMSRILPDHKVDAVVVGTYAKAGEESIVVSARMVDGKTQNVISAGSMIVDAKPGNKFVIALLGNEVTTVMPEETVEGY